MKVSGVIFVIKGHFGVGGSWFRINEPGLILGIACHLLVGSGPATNPPKNTSNKNSNDMFILNAEKKTTM